MSVLDLLWIVLILAVLQPMLRQRWLNAMRARAIARLERQRSSRVILLVHRQETMSLLGFPLLRYIDVQDSEEVMRAIDMTDEDVPLDLVLHTPGGLVLASLQIARALQRHRGKVTVFVPHYAMSGGTLIALAADEIVMTPHAVLGPVDPQIRQYPAASVLRVLEHKPMAQIDDETLILADQAHKALGQMRQSLRVLLAHHFDADKADELARLFSAGTWTHDYPIDCEAARQMGLPVSDEMPAEVLKLMALFPQPVRRTSAVEYLPFPHPGPRRGPERTARTPEGA